MECDVTIEDMTDWSYLDELLPKALALRSQVAAAQRGAHGNAIPTGTSQNSHRQVMAPSSADGRSGSDSWRVLFNRLDFHTLNQRAGLEPVLVEVQDSRGRLLGGLSGMRDGDTFVGGFGAPFGGLDVVDSQAHNVAHVIEDSAHQLQDAGIQQIRLKMPPACFDAVEIMVQVAVNNGFAVERTDVTQHVQIASWPSEDAFLASRAPGVADSLQRLPGQDFAFSEVTDGRNFALAHHSLVDQGRQSGCTFGLSLPHLHSARGALNAELRLFQVLHGDALAGTALMYRVRPRQCLVLAWVDAESPFAGSSLLTLAHGVVTTSIAEGMATLDLGLAHDGRPRLAGSSNSGAVLEQLQRILPATTEARFTLVRKLA